MRPAPLRYYTYGTWAISVRQTGYREREIEIQSVVDCRVSGGIFQPALSPDCFAGCVAIVDEPALLLPPLFELSFSRLLDNCAKFLNKLELTNLG